MPQFNGTITLASDVKDLDAAIAWFKDALGFEETFKVAEAGWAEVSTPAERRDHRPQPERRGARTRRRHPRVRRCRHRRGARGTGRQRRAFRRRHHRAARHGEARHLLRPGWQHLHAGAILGRLKPRVGGSAPAVKPHAATKKRSVRLRHQAGSWTPTTSGQPGQHRQRQGLGGGSEPAAHADAERVATLVESHSPQPIPPMENANHRRGFAACWRVGAALLCAGAAAEEPATAVAADHTAGAADVRRRLGVLRRLVSGAGAANRQRRSRAAGKSHRRSRRRVPATRRQPSTRAMTNPYQIDFDIATIKHLGLQMYATLPLVIGELVANAWDASPPRRRLPSRRRRRVDFRASWVWPRSEIRP